MSKLFLPDVVSKSLVIVRVACPKACPKLRLRMNEMDIFHFSFKSVLVSNCC